MKCHGGLDLISCWTEKRAQAKVTMAAIAWDLLKLMSILAKTPKNGHLRRFLGLLRSIYDYISGSWSPLAMAPAQ